MATISQRISLEGSEDIRKKLEALGSAGVQAFKQIQDAAKQPITDPGQIDKTKQALDQLATTTTKLGPQFQALAESTRQFGQAGAQASQQVAAGLSQTEAAAQKASTALAGAAGQARSAGQNAGAGLISAATAFKIAAVGIVAAIAAITDALVKGTVETGTKIAEQAEKLKLTTAQWVELRKGISSAGLKSDDFVSATSKIGAAMEKAKGGVATLTNGLREQAFQTENGIVTIMSFGNASGKAETEADNYATTLRRLGVSWETIMSGDTNAALREAAQNIKAIDNETERTKVGLERFGKDWEKIVNILTGTQKIDPLKAGRELLPDQVEKTVKLKAAWEDLGDALRATKDQIGALFLDSSLTRTEWLTALVDGSRELFKIWSGLSNVDKGAFLAGLGDSAAEQVFKVLISLGDQLGGIWRDVLVPAGKALLEMFNGIAGEFEGVTKSQVAAFFITAAIAAVGLAVALKGIAFVLSPLAALLSLAFSPLGIALAAAAVAAALFWDQLKEGANSVLAQLPQEIAQVKEALQLLFKGDFAGAWEKFSAAAVSAFATIKEAFLQSNFGTQVLLTVVSLGVAFIGLRRAAGGVATAINAIFGTKLTGLGVAAIGAVAQYTGALQALASIAIIAGVVTRGIVGAITLLGGAIGVVPTAILLAAGALTGFVLSLDGAYEAVKKFFTALVNADASGMKQAMDELGAIIKKEIFGIGEKSGEEFGQGFMSKAVAAGAASGKAFGEALLASIKEALTPAGGFNLQGIFDAIKKDFDKFWQSGIRPEDALKRIQEQEKAGQTRLKLGDLSPISGAKAAEGGGSDFGPMIAAAEVAAARIKAIFADVLSGQSITIDFSTIVTAAQTAAAEVSAAFANFDIASAAQTAVTDLQLLFSTASQQIAESFSAIDITSGLATQLDTLIQKLNELAEAAKAAASAAASVGSGGGGGGAPAPAPFARGGLLGGRGTGSSDSNLAWLSRGEYIMPARAVQQPGVLAFLEALRRSGKIPGFARGGVIPGFAAGGLVGDAGASVIDSIIAAVNEIDVAMRSYSANLLSNFAELDRSMAGIQRTIVTQVENVNKAVGGVRRIEWISGPSARHARGGLLGGRGTGTSDSNLSWVSRGEHIMPARAVRQPGVLAFLEALRRSGGNLRDVLDGMGRFALGGMVPRAIPAFATGGLAGGMSNVTIAFPGLPPISGLRASSDVVDQLHRAAALAQVRSGGRKPSRYS